MADETERRVDRIVDRITQKPLKGAWLATALVTLSVVLVAGILIRVTDPDTFHNLGEGLWWAVQTVTTVGYGDVVPASTAGRVIATLVMIVGIGFLTVSTAAIASAFVEAARERREAAGRAVPADGPERELTALRDEVGALRAEIAELRRDLRSPGGGDPA